MQIIESVLIACYESSQHVQFEPSLFIGESDRAVKESSSEMCEFDGGFKVLVHLDH